MSPTIAAVAIVISLLAVVTCAGLVAFLLRQRSRGSASSDMERGRTRSTRPYSVMPVDGRHPASRITPFGTRDPDRPGEGMRVAHRRDDGVWEFFDSDPQETLSPSLEPLPRIHTPDPFSPSANSYLARANSLLRPSRMTTTGLDADAMPPSPTETTTSATLTSFSATKTDKDKDATRGFGYGGYLSTPYDECLPPPPAYTYAPSHRPTSPGFSVVSPHS